MEVQERHLQEGAAGGFEAASASENDPDLALHHIASGRVPRRRSRLWTVAAAAFTVLLISVTAEALGKRRLAKPESKPVEDEAKERHLVEPEIPYGGIAVGKEGEGQGDAEEKLGPTDQRAEDEVTADNPQPSDGDEAVAGPGIEEGLGEAEERTEDQPEPEPEDKPEDKPKDSDGEETVAGPGTEEGLGKAEERTEDQPEPEPGDKPKPSDVEEAVAGPGTEEGLGKAEERTEDEWGPEPGDKTTPSDGDEPVAEPGIEEGLEKAEENIEDKAKREKEREGAEKRMAEPTYGPMPICTGPEEAHQLSVLFAFGGTMEFRRPLPRGQSDRGEPEYASFLVTCLPVPWIHPHDLTEDKIALNSIIRTRMIDHERPKAAVDKAIQELIDQPYKPGSNPVKTLIIQDFGIFYVQRASDIQTEAPDPYARGPVEPTPTRQLRNEIFVETKEEAAAAIEASILSGRAVLEVHLPNKDLFLCVNQPERTGNAVVLAEPLAILSEDHRLDWRSFRRHLLRTVYTLVETTTDPPQGVFTTNLSPGPGSPVTTIFSIFWKDKDDGTSVEQSK